MILVVLVLIWALGIAVILRDLDRERSAREKAARKVRPLTQDEEAARALYRKRDRDRVHALRATRYADQQLWEMRRHEAEHIKHVRDRRKLWTERLGRASEPSEVNHE
jgi:ABC-type nickel/cobalt efflux system permease component RcnA